MFFIVTGILAWFVLLYAGTSQNLHFTIKVILVWGMLVYIGVNLVGFVMRNFVSWLLSPVDPSEDVSEDFKEFFAREMRANRAADKTTGLIFLVLTVAYLFAIYHYWKVGLVVSAVLVMIARFPDLLWEIRTGKRVSKTNMPKGIVYNLGSLVIFLTLPLTWYSLCK
ncbi:MAG: hypothetical protein ISS71_04465 [Phycisphaerae bacterium]|nr:hypothetical protein [Phycisphaerae bacterium]